MDRRVREMKREGLDLRRARRWLYEAVRLSTSAGDRLAAAGEFAWMTGGNVISGLRRDM